MICDKPSCFVIVPIVLSCLFAPTAQAQDGTPSSEEPSAVDQGAAANDASDPVPQPLGQGPGSASGSNASNYRPGVSVNVNPRTGAVEANVRVFHLPGKSAGLDAGLTLSYSSTTRFQSSAQTPTPFHMPLGWTVNLSNRIFNGDRQVHEINIDGQQSYVEDASWTSLFQDAQGNTTSFTTGLLQYNRADANLQETTGSDVVTVNGINSRYVITTLDGRRRHISSGGLLLQEANRFGATHQYTYLDGPQAVEDNRIGTITDTWGNVITFDWAPAPPQEPRSVTITLPDSRVVSFAWTEAGITEVVDEQGKKTLLQYDTPDCGSPNVQPVPLLSGVTSPSGSMTAIAYSTANEGNCLSVCTESPGQGTCATELWPVATRVTVCPSNSSGTECTANNTNNPSKNNMVTEYAYRTSSLENNYTGFPLVTPYGTQSPPGSDPLLVDPDAVGFTYRTETTTRNGGPIARKTISEHDHLHRLKQAWHCVPGASNASDPCADAGMATSKKEAHCYSVPDQNGACGDAEVRGVSAPANYQSAKVSGSCVYSVGGVGTQGVRLSVVERDHNGFGHVVRTTKYHGTTSTGVKADCSNNQLFAPVQTGLQLVSDVFAEYDLPATPSVGDYFELGASHYGQLTGHLGFYYLDADGTGLAAHQALGSGDTPIRVTLACYSLTELGAGVGANTLPAVETMGLLAQSTQKPSEPGIVPHCDNPQWVSSVPGPVGPVKIAPAKRSTFKYENAGRLTEHNEAWLDGTNQPGTTQSTTSTVSYTITSPAVGTTEASQCGTGNVVESVAHTDAEQNTTVVRHCIQNGWVLAHIDADGDRTSFEHDDVGMTTRLTEPNGDFTIADYYYRCPHDPNGNPTCPNPCPKDAQGNPICAGCPYPPAAPASQYSCVAHGQFAGPGNTSFADGIRHVTIKDGLGRTIRTHDNLGAMSGGMYDAWQPRSATTYDSRGLRTLQVSQIGASAPLIHTTMTSYNATFQPNLICGSHGVAHETVHDNVGLARKLLLNGHQHTRHQHNDSMHLTGQSDCPLVAGSPTTQPCAATSDGTSACCPATSSDTKAATCSGSLYQTSARLDGSGVAHVTTGSDSDAESQGSSIESISGTMTHDAMLQKYGYYVQGTAADGGTSPLTVTSTASWERDLNGRPVLHKLAVSNAPTGVTSDTYDYDGIGRQTDEYSKLQLPYPQESFYTPTSQLSHLTDYAGHTFYSYYDSMKRRVRYCYPPDTDTRGTGGAGGSTGSGSQGRKYTYDSITGQMTSVTHFDNPSKCPARCANGNCGQQDVDGDSIGYAYSRFGALLTKTYSQVTDNENFCATPLKKGRCITQLSWGYDVYQRPVCFADAVATAAGNTCPATAIALGWSPNPSTQLAWRTYWEQNNSYKRGLLKSACRGVIKDANTYETQCTDFDYYTSEDTGGGENCPASVAYGQGALAGLVKSRQVCVGGSCLDGNGTMVYKQETHYDVHRRPCSQRSTNDTGNVVLHSTYTYDQYDNVILETHESDLDTSSSSNYQQAHQYDGLMRLVCSVRGDQNGNPTQSFAYEYDAFSNITKRTVKTGDSLTPSLGGGDGLLGVCDTGGTGGTGGIGGTGGRGGFAGPPPTPMGGSGGSSPPGSLGLGGCTVASAQRAPTDIFVLFLIGWLAARAVRSRH